MTVLVSVGSKILETAFYAIMRHATPVFFNSITSDCEQIKWTVKFSSIRIKHRHEYKIIFHGILPNEVIRENIRKLIIENFYEYTMCLNTRAHHIQKWFLQYLLDKTIFHLSYISYIPYIYIWLLLQIYHYIHTNMNLHKYFQFNNEIRLFWLYQENLKSVQINCKQIFTTKSTKSKTVYNK